LLKTDTNNTTTAVATSKPISPPFVFRDPDKLEKVYGCAHSIRELAEILPYIPYYSIQYHTYRIEPDNIVTNDLATWLRYVLGLNELADKVEEIAKEHAGMKLKEALIRVFNEHMFEE